MRYRKQKHRKPSYNADSIIHTSGYLPDGDTRYRIWLKHCATSQKIWGSNPDEVIGLFHIMALGSTQPLTEMSSRNLPGTKGRVERKVDILTAVCEPIV
jgi:hypothetical protein